MRAEPVVATAVLVLLGLMTGTAWSYPPEARLVPLVVGIPGVLLAVGVAAWDLRSGNARAPRSGSHDSGHARDTVAFAWLAAFVALVLTGGLVLGGTIAVIVSMRFWLGERWPQALAGGATALFVSRVLFEEWLGLLLFDGWLIGILR